MRRILCPYSAYYCGHREIDEKTAEEINKIFVEIVIAPSFTEGH